ncbi:MAG: outer membrane beta-barrel protein [Deltaproteobacteria bacterium]|nr:outer membrane beta-barrel protein [Deltaproteobacteria bacterium]MBW2658202.1 outer membrane beta-barrel protein [Deltaproteobacteria bacterium]
MNTRIKISALVAAAFIMSMHAQYGSAAGRLLPSSNKIPVLSTQSKGGGSSMAAQEDDAANPEKLFGKEGGYFHPFISLGLEYTDNLFNLDDKFPGGETENLLTMVSPGIWFSLPRTKIIPITIKPNNTSPGGLQQQTENYRSFDRFQAYGLAGLDFKYYSEDSDLNKTDGVLEGMLGYNLRGGLGMQVVDRYTHGEDELDASTLLREQARAYDSNLLLAIADWDVTEKVRTKLEYNNFYLSYEDDINSFMDRVDNGADLYGYYNYSLKTALFLEYKYINAVYDRSSLRDNDSHFFYGGIEWDSTEKTDMLFKLGYQKKIFDDEFLDDDDWDGVVFDLQLRYRYSEKTHLSFDFYRTNDASDSYQASDQTVLGAVVKYDQKFSDKLSGSLDFAYEDIDYSNAHLVVAADRDDDTFAARPALQYLFRRWLMFELAYEYETRASTDDFFEYDTNTFMLNANLSL